MALPCWMGVRELSIALDESVAETAANAAVTHGMSLSAWMNAATGRAIALESRLAAIREWAFEQGELPAEEMSWTDVVLGTGSETGDT